MFIKRIQFLLISLFTVFILSGWSGPYLETGGELFITGVKVFLGYVALVFTASVLFIFFNWKSLKDPETQFWNIALRMFKLFWIIPTVFFIIVLGLLIAFELMGPVFIF